MKTKKGVRLAKAVNFVNRNGDRVNMIRVAHLFNSGKTVSQISDALGFTDKKSDWPYSYTYGLLKALRAKNCLKSRRGK
jgi:hypothetical protein